MRQYLLTILILLPVLGAVVCAVYNLATKNEAHFKWIALAFSVLTFALSLLLISGSGTAGYTFEQNVNWIGAIGARYHVAVDGISLWLVLLTTLLMPIAILSSWTAIKKRQLSYYIFLLLLEGAMIGVFVSLDLLLFYLFFEASLVPMFFLIGIWGGERRIYAAVKFFIYTAVGSLLMLVGIIALYFIFGSFDYVTILQAMSTNAVCAFAARGVLVVPGVCFCLLHQDSALPTAHLAAGCAHRSAHSRIRDSCRRAFEDGNLWAPAF